MIDKGIEYLLGINLFAYSSIFIPCFVAKSEYLLLYVPSGSYFFSNLSQCCGFLSIKYRITFSLPLFCFSLHFEHPVATASGSASKTKIQIFHHHSC